MPTKTNSVSHGRIERLRRRGVVGSTGSDVSSSRALTSIVDSRGTGGGAGKRGGGSDVIADGGADRGGTDGGGDIAISVRAMPSSSTMALRTSSRISAALA
jgi:hypothetical protein